eukprot:1156812-Pelagomonas_calceolata.AAC.4
MQIRGHCAWAYWFAHAHAPSRSDGSIICRRSQAFSVDHITQNSSHSFLEFMSVSFFLMRSKAMHRPAVCVGAPLTAHAAATPPAGTSALWPHLKLRSTGSRQPVMRGSMKRSCSSDATYKHIIAGILEAEEFSWQPAFDDWPCQALMLL